MSTFFFRTGRRVGGGGGRGTNAFKSDSFKISTDRSFEISERILPEANSFGNRIFGVPIQLSILETGERVFFAARSLEILVRNEKYRERFSSVCRFEKFLSPEYFYYVNSSSPLGLCRSHTFEGHPLRFVDATKKIGFLSFFFLFLCSSIFNLTFLGKTKTRTEKIERQKKIISTKSALSTFNLSSTLVTLPWETREYTL